MTAPSDIASVALLAALLAPPSRAQGEGAPAATAPALVVRFEQGAASDARHARLAALYVAQGAPPTPFLAAGPFRATFRGWLEVAQRDRYRFSVEGTGTAVLRIAGAEVALGQPLRIAPGAHAFELGYASPVAGDAELRVLWAADFGPEPLGPQQLRHDPADPELRAGMQRRRGRALLAQHACTRCHIPPRAFVLEDGSMPELDRDAPALDEVGGRLRQGWLAAWVLDPRAMRRDATMPRMFVGPDAAQQAADVAAYLAGLGRAPDGAPDPARAPAGGVLFAELGCIGCHPLPDAPADHERVPLAALGAKWHGVALADYLRAPDRHYGWTGMPDFGLDAGEAEALAAFLLARAPPPADTAPPGDAARGKELVVTRGCLLCHFVGEIGQHRAPRWDELGDFAAGCMAADAEARGAAPDLGLDDARRSDLRAAVPGLAHLGRCAPAEAAERRIAELRCGACHERDGVPAAWSRHAAEVAPLLAGTEPPQLAQLRPSLSWTGEKLRADWIEKLLAGEIHERPRPWLRARMPALRAGAAVVAQGLAAQHGYGPSAAATAVDPALAAAGGTLVSSTGGFACGLCHGVGGRPPTGVFEAQGIDLMLTAERLRKPYFDRWMRDPLRIDPASRMPKYADPRGKTGFLLILDGDAQRQFDAMWHWLSAGRALK